MLATVDARRRRPDDGGDGILLDNHVARHHADMEAIFTFEGTDSVQALIVGREITGLSAISGRKPTR